MAAGAIRSASKVWSQNGTKRHIRGSFRTNRGASPNSAWERPAAFVAQIVRHRQPEPFRLQPCERVPAAAGGAKHPLMKFVEDRRLAITSRIVRIRRQQCLGTLGTQPNEQACDSRRATSVHAEDEEGFAVHSTTHPVSSIADRPNERNTRRPRRRMSCGARPRHVVTGAT